MRTVKSISKLAASPLFFKQAYDWGTYVYAGLYGYGLNPSKAQLQTSSFLWPLTITNGLICT